MLNVFSSGKKKSETHFYYIDLFGIKKKEDN